MSLFRKPKRNIARRKDYESHDDDLVDNSTENIINTANKDGQTSLGPKVPEQTKLLSFGEAWNEGDDGEVFKVRKTSQSKKIRKQFEKKNAEKIKKDIDKVMHANNAHKMKPENENYKDELTIKIKNPIAGPVATSDRILSGINAEMAGYESESDGEYDDTNRDNGGHNKYNQQNEFKILLQSGKIPDAAFIHAARKRRQQARETGTNYIPLEEEKIKESNESKSRLVRDDDSDEEERISMAGIVTNASEIEKRKEDFEISIDSDDDNENNRDDNEWIRQQIEKGVGTQLNSVQQENVYQHNGNSIIASSNNPLVTPSFNLTDNYFSQTTTNESTEHLEPGNIVSKLRESIDYFAHPIKLKMKLQERKYR